MLRNSLNLRKAALILLAFSSCAAGADLFSFGIKGGVPLTAAVSEIGGANGFSNSSNGYLIGPSGELHLILGLSVEADALYRPIDVNVNSASGFLTSVTASHSHSWEFPVVAKYRFLHTPFVKPYVEAGPSFRTVSGSRGSGASTAGFTLGGGVEVKLLRLRAGPEIRYTHWGAGGTFPAFVFGQNQAEFLVGISF